MPAVALEFTTLQITVALGASLTDQVLGTIAGAVSTNGGGVRIVKRERSGDSTIYTILVVHDTTGAVNLEWSYREVKVTKGTDVTDATLATVAGIIQGTDISLVESTGDIITYAFFVIHLNA